MMMANRAGGFRAVFVCVAILFQAIHGDNIDCQDVQCLHPNITNGEAKQLIVSKNLKSTVTTPFGDYSNYGQAGGGGGSELEYGNYDYDSNGNVILKYSLYTQMTVRCNHGYLFRTNFTGTIECQRLRSSAGDCGVGWSEDTSTLCSPALCNPKDLKNAKLTATCDDVITLTGPVPINQTACLNCEGGFRLTDDTGRELPSLMIRCKETGEWDAAGMCTNAKACQELAVPTYGSVLSFNSLSRVVFGCDDRFLMVGRPTLECENGSWSGEPPLCRFKASCLTNTLSNGNISVDPSKMGPGPWVRNSISATYTCEPGFTHLTNRTSISCVRGEWEPKPRCVLDKPFACPGISVIAHGAVRLTPSSRILPGTEAKVTCDPGFALHGSANRTCLETGSWSGTRSSCSPMTRCRAPPIVNNAFTPTVRDYTEGDVVRYRCKPGYQLTGQSRITCSKRGSWTEIDFHCTAVSCGRPSSIPNAIREGNSFRFGDQVTYKCLPGYKMVSGILTSRVCQPNRRWTVIGMRCEEARCPDLPHIPHGTLTHISGWSLKHRSIYRYTCDRGYKFSGADSGDSVELRCGGNQAWDKSVPSCEIVKCPLLTSPVHGILTPNADTKDGMEYGTGYAVGCAPGYKLKGKEPGEELLWLCQQDGTWSGEQAECQAMTCPGLTVPSHGKLTRLSTGVTSAEFAYGSKYSISCFYGYKLRGREPNDVIWRSCQYDGTWTNADDAFCEDRRIFRSRSEWAKFLRDHTRNCCPLWRENGYEWDYSRCSLNGDVKWECITDHSWNAFKDHVCYREEINEKGSMGRIDKDQTWYALLGVKVPKYYNQCCWNHPEKGPYACYEYPSKWLV